jgi:cytochrome c oxidase cbb3-type subunit 1
LIVGIFPLITGPWIGMGRTVTATGLVLFGTGFALYLYNLVQTYRSAGSRPGISLSVLVAQFWLLGPAGFAPFVLFGVEWVEPAYIEDGALHFFFVGWALPIALAGVLLYFRNLPALREGGPGSSDLYDSIDLLPDGAIPPVIETWMVWIWNLAILTVGVGFFYQDQSWSAYLFAPGYTVLVVLWLYELAQAFRLRWGSRTESEPTTDSGL